jgi:hypothetical protein
VVISNSIQFSGGFNMAFAIGALFTLVALFDRPIPRGTKGTVARQESVQEN